jgi:hypothetical protein
MAFLRTGQSEKPGGDVSLITADLRQQAFFTAY